VLRIIIIIQCFPMTWQAALPSMRRHEYLTSSSHDVHSWGDALGHVPHRFFKGNNIMQLYLYMLASSSQASSLSLAAFYPKSQGVYCWKWSSLNCVSVQNPVQISVHCPVHSPVHSPVHGPWSSFYTYPKFSGYTVCTIIVCIFLVNVQFITFTSNNNIINF
jgi:hypothetical protein